MQFAVAEYFFGLCEGAELEGSVLCSMAAAVWWKAIRWCGTTGLCSTTTGAVHSAATDFWDTTLQFCVLLLLLVLSVFLLSGATADTVE